MHGPRELEPGGALPRFSRRLSPRRSRLVSPHCRRARRRSAAPSRSVTALIAAPPCAPFLSDDREHSVSVLVKPPHRHASFTVLQVLGDGRPLQHRPRATRDIRNPSCNCYKSDARNRLVMVQVSIVRVHDPREGCATEGRASQTCGTRPLDRRASSSSSTTDTPRRLPSAACLGRLHDQRRLRLEAGALNRFGSASLTSSL